MNSSIRTSHHRPTARLLAAAFLCVGAVGAVAGPANAETDQVCGPLTSGKIDTSGDPATVTVTLSDADIAAGKVITGYCVKAGSAQQADGGPVYVTLDPPVTTITFGHPTGKDVSHYSYSVGVTTPPTTTPETTTPETTTPETTTPETTTPETTTPETTTPETTTPTPTPETTTPTPDVLGEQATAPTGTSNQPQAQAQPQSQVQPQQSQAQPRSQQALPTAVNAGASADAPVSGTESLLALLLVLLGAVSARIGWIRARG
jgi:hypothetical protein